MMQVLATDMSKHIEHLAEIKTLLEAKHVANDGILVLDEYSERLAVSCLLLKGGTTPETTEI